MNTQWNEDVQGPTKIQVAFPWRASLLKYEKWINRARGEKFYVTLFFAGNRRGMRYSKHTSKTAFGALEYAARFNATVLRLELLGYFKHELQRPEDTSV